MINTVTDYSCLCDCDSEKQKRSIVGNGKDVEGTITFLLCRKTIYCMVERE